MNIVEFENLLEEHRGLLVMLANRIREYDSSFRYADYDELMAVVQYAAWTAYLDYIKKPTPYKYVTFLTKHIQLAKNRVFKECHHKQDVEYSDNTTSPLDFKAATSDPMLNNVDLKDYFDKIFSHLTPEEMRFINNRIFQDKTLEECGQLCNRSISSMYIFEKKTLDKIRAYANKYS